MAGRLPRSELSGAIGRARGFIFAALEDFGIAPVEAQACGTPVIAYGRGGALETVRAVGQPNPTGLFFGEQTPDAIANAVTEFERVRNEISPLDCRENAERFSPEAFDQRFSQCVANVVKHFRKLPAPHMTALDNAVLTSGREELASR
jgi:glycosyltransferase involved in cell wall biosynthesis